METRPTMATVMKKKKYNIAQWKMSATCALNSTLRDFQSSKERMSAGKECLEKEKNNSSSSPTLPTDAEIITSKLGKLQISEEEDELNKKMTAPHDLQVNDDDSQKILCLEKQKKKKKKKKKKTKKQNKNTTAEAAEKEVIPSELSKLQILEKNFSEKTGKLLLKEKIFPDSMPEEGYDYANEDMDTRIARKGKQLMEVAAKVRKCLGNPTTVINPLELGLGTFDITGDNVFYDPKDIPTLILEEIQNPTEMTPGDKKFFETLDEGMRSGKLAKTIMEILNKMPKNHPCDIDSSVQEPHCSKVAEEEGEPSYQRITCLENKKKIKKQKKNKINKSAKNLSKNNDLHFGLLKDINNGDNFHFDNKSLQSRTKKDIARIKQSTLDKRRRRKKFLKPFRKECAQIAVEVHRDVSVEWIVEHMTRLDEERQKALEAKIAFIRNA